VLQVDEPSTKMGGTAASGWHCSDRLQPLRHAEDSDAALARTGALTLAARRPFGCLHARTAKACAISHEHEHARARATAAPSASEEAREEEWWRGPARRVGVRHMSLTVHVRVAGGKAAPAGEQPRKGIARAAARFAARVVRCRLAARDRTAGVDAVRRGGGFQGCRVG